MMNDDPYDVICPACGQMAQFHEPFVFLNRTPKKDEQHVYHQWGGWYVMERFPHLLQWTPPQSSSDQVLRGAGDDKPGYRMWQKGVVLCSHCHDNRVHVLSWPEDAWWRWEVRGRLLYARNRQDALRILAFVRQKLRPKRWFRSSLGHVPTHFLTEQVRDEVVSRMQRSLLGS